MGWQNMQDTIKNVTDIISTSVECMNDMVTLYAENPDLEKADDAYWYSYSYKETSEGDAESQKDSSMITFDEKSFADYKSACEAVSSGAVWLEVPTPTTFSCVTEDDSYKFDVTYYNLGTCYPNAPACGESKESAEELFSEELSEDFESQCQVAVGATEPSMEDASSAAMMTSISVVVITAVGTVLYL